jgi:hypothetical protein
MTGNYAPRFQFEITEEQRLKADKLLSQHGLRKAIFSKILDDVLNIIETHGGLAIGLMMSDQVQLKEIIPTMKSVDSVKKVKPKKNGD